MFFNMNRCDQEIFENGQPVVALDARSEAAEKWVCAVAKEANASVDWHYSGGIAQVLHLGNDESRARVEAAIDKLSHKLDGTIMRRFSKEEQGLFRAGVTETPDGAIASSIDPFSGKPIYH